MDQYLSAIIIAVITGVFSVVTLIIQKRQDKVISKIDKQTAFIEKEKSLKQKLAKKQEEQQALIHAIVILILDTNLSIIKITSGDTKTDKKVFDKAEEIKTSFNSVVHDIESLNKEYEMLLDLTTAFENEQKDKDKKK